MKAKSLAAASFDAPKGTLTLKDLPERYGPLVFLAPGSPKPTFENDRESVTRQAADCLADCFKKPGQEFRSPKGTAK